MLLGFMLGFHSYPSSDGICTRPPYIYNQLLLAYTTWLPTPKKDCSGIAAIHYDQHDSAWNKPKQPYTLG